MNQVAHKYWQSLVNVLLVLLFGFFIAKELFKSIADGPSFVDVSFAIHNVIFLGVILIRRDHQAINMKLSHQAVALVAFFSGLAFIDAEVVSRISGFFKGVDVTVMPAAPQVAAAIIAVSWLLGAIVTVSLGRSFGILIALRKVKTGGAYRIVRHPMYVTDILFRVGVVLKYPYWYNIVIFVGSSACYLYRAVLEERFLSQSEDYRRYMEKVRYRFLPGIF